MNELLANKMFEQLLQSDEPAIRYKLRANVLQENPRSKKIKQLRAEIAEAPRVCALLSERDARGEIARPPYSKWSGAQWVLTMLAELEYPPGDTRLMPMCEQMLAWLFSKNMKRN
jgi:hypothetical protein